MKEQTQKGVPNLDVEVENKQYEEVKKKLVTYFETAIDNRKVYWQKDEVIDRSIDIVGFTGRVRYIPTFAYRRTIYDKENVGSKCLLCESLLSKEMVVPLPKIDIPDQDFVKEFEDSFVIRLNTFPYLDSQLLLTSRQHSSVFTLRQYFLIFEFMRKVRFAGASLQVEGSGATIPEHAHISIFNETLPIFSSNQQTLMAVGETNITISSEHPSVCYKISGGSSTNKLEQTINILEKLDKQHLSFNLYFDENANTYIIPRTNRRSSSLDWKIGSSLPAGIHNGYIEHSINDDIEVLKAEILEACNSITGEQLATALRETTYQGDPMQLLSFPV